MWVWLKLKLTLKEDFCVVSVRAIFENFFSAVLNDTWIGN